MKANIEIKNMLRITTMLFLLAIAVGFVSAQDDPNPKKTEESEKIVLSPVQKKMLKKISVDFRETPIEDVLRSIAQQSNIDIIKSPKVIGEVTATLTDIPLGEVLTNILSTHGYAYKLSDNMALVMPAEEINQEKMKLVNRVYRITYADAQEVHNALTRFISNEGSIAFNKGTSNLMITETESKIKAIDTFIEEVDRITKQIVVEARIYDVSSEDSLDLGIEWTAGRNTNFEDGIGTLGGVSGITDPFISGEFIGTTSNTSSTDALVRFGILNSSLNIDAIIRAEKEDIQAKLLANPRVMVLDNEEALIKIIEEIPFQELTQTTAGGNIGTTEFREVGVELLVIPHVTRDGLIRLKIHTKFSMTSDKAQPAGINNPFPQPIVDNRETRTTALVKDSQTVVIGGLRKQEVLDQVNKIPLLGDLPLLGGLFKFIGKQEIVNELVIFITPHIVEQPVLTELEAQRFLDSNPPFPKSPTIEKAEGSEEITEF